MYVGGGDDRQRPADRRVGAHPGHLERRARGGRPSLTRRRARGHARPDATSAWDCRGGDRRLGLRHPRRPDRTATRRRPERNHHGDGVPATGPFGPQGERVVVRVVGHVRPAARRRPRRGLPGRGHERRASTSSTTPSRTPGGESERIMGEAIAKLGWPRHSYVVSTKVFWGLHDDVNMQNTLNRKYLMQAIDGSLERLGLDFVDLLFCHRADPNPHRGDGVGDVRHRGSGRALYWGTSEWTADEIRAAWDIAERHHLHKPVMEQPQYNLLERSRSSPSTPGSTTTSGSGSPPRARSPRAAHRQVPRRHPRRQPGRAARLRVAAGHADRREDATRRCGVQGRSPTTSTARWRSCRSRGARRTRTCRR